MQSFGVVSGPKAFGITLALAAILPALAGCCFYRDRVEVRFKNHEYTNWKAIPEISMWWEPTTGRVDQVALLYIGERTEGTDSLLRIGFVRDPGTMERVVIKSIRLSHAQGDIRDELLTSPEELQFVDETFPLFDGETSEGKTVHRDYAEVQISTDLLPANSPYNLTMRGVYMFKDGRTEDFDIEEEVRVRRTRALYSVEEAF